MTQKESDCKSMNLFSFTQKSHLTSLNLRWKGKERQAFWDIQSQCVFLMVCICECVWGLPLREVTFLSLSLGYLYF